MKKVTGRKISKTYRIEEHSHQFLCGMAEKKNVSISSYVRELICSDEKTCLTEKYRNNFLLRKKLANELNHIFVNVNQIIDGSSILYSREDREKMKRKLLIIRKMMESR